MTAPWSNVTAPTGPAWAPLSSVVSTTDDGVDFRLLLRDNYPWRLDEDRPVSLRDLQPEGRP